MKTVLHAHILHNKQILHLCKWPKNRQNLSVNLTGFKIFSTTSTCTDLEWIRSNDSLPFLHAFYAFTVPLMGLVLFLIEFLIVFGGKIIVVYTPIGNL